MKKYLKYLLIVTLATALLGIATSVLVVNPFTQGMIHRLVQERLAPHKLNLQFEKFELSWLPLQVRFHGVAFNTATGSPNTNQIVTKTIQADISWISLFLGSPQITLVRIVEPSLHLEALEEVVDLLQQLGDKDSAPVPGKEKRKVNFTEPFLALPLRSIMIDNAVGFVGYHLNETGKTPTAFAFTFGPSDISLFKTTTNDIFIGTRFEDLTARKNSQTLVSKLLFQATWRIEKQSISSNNISFKAPDWSLGGSANLLGLSKNNEQSFFVTSAWNADLDLTPLGTLLNLKKTQGRFTGKIDLDAEIPPHPEDWDFYASVGGHVEDGFVDAFHLFDTDVRLSFDKEKLVFDEISIKEANKQLIKGTGSIGFTKEMPLVFDVSYVDISLGSLLTALDVDFDVVDLMVNSKKVQLRGQVENFSLDIKADAEVQDLQIKDFPRLNAGLKALSSCKAGVHIEVDTHRTAFNPITAECRTTAQEAPSTIKLSGPIHYDANKGIDLRIEGEQVNLSLVKTTVPFNLAGRATADVTIAGPHKAIVSTIKVSGNDARVNQATIDRFAANLKITEEQLTWDHAQITLQDGGEINSPAGHLDFDSLVLDAQATAHHLSQASVGNVLVDISALPAVSASVNSVKIDFKGQLLKPGSYRGSIEADITKLASGSTTLADALTFTLSRTAGELSLQNARYRIAALGADISLAIKTPHAPSLNALPEWDDYNRIPLWQLFGFNPTDAIKSSFGTFIQPPEEDQSKLVAATTAPTLAMLPYIGTYLEDAGVSGDIALQGEINGTVSNPEGTLQGALEQLRFMRGPLLPVSFNASLNRGNLNLKVKQPGQTFDADLWTNLQAPSLPYKWSMKFKQMDIRALGSTLFYEGAQNYAYLSGSWTMAGTFSDWWGSQGEFILSDIHWHYQGTFAEGKQAIHLRNTKEARLVMSPSAWYFHPAYPLEVVGDNLHITAGLEHSTPPHHLNLSAMAEIDIGLLRAFVDGVETATGKVALSTSISGSISKPVLSGRLHNLTKSNGAANEDAGREKLSFGLVDHKPPLRDIDLDLTLDKGVLTVNRFNAQKGAGILTGSGRVDLLNEVPQVSSPVVLNFQRAKFIYAAPVIKEVEATLSGALQLTRDRGPLAITGTISIDQLLARQNIDLEKDLIAWFREDRAVTESRGGSSSPLLRYQIAIKSDQSIKVKNETIDMVLSAALEVVGDTNKANLNGSIKTDRGVVEFKRKFTIRRAEVLFNDPVKINPLLEIQAETSMTGRTVIVLVSGEASDPNIELSVNPPQHDDGRPITQQEALILLSTGELPEDTAENLALGSQGISTVANYLGQTQLETLTLVLNQKYLKIYPEIAVDETGAPQFQLVAPLKITDQIGVVFRAGRKSTKASLEFPINDIITLSGSKTQLNENGNEETPDTNGLEQGSADLRFKIPFK